MKKTKLFLVLLIIFIVCDFVLVFVDDGNHLETKKYEATVLSCELNENSGLDTYYIVKYEYIYEDSTIQGTDSYYATEVNVGDKITVKKRETVTSSYSSYLFYASIVCNVIVGVLAFALAISFISSRKVTNSNEEKGN